MHDHYMMEGSLFSVLVVASRDGIPFVTLTPLCLFGFVLSTALSAPIVFFFFFIPFLSLSYTPVFRCFIGPWLYH